MSVALRLDASIDLTCILLHGGFQQFQQLTEYMACTSRGHSFTCTNQHEAIVSVL
jgi:hypothetical protein